MESVDVMVEVVEEGFVVKEGVRGDETGVLRISCLCL